MVRKTKAPKVWENNKQNIQCQQEQSIDEQSASIQEEQSSYSDQNQEKSYNDSQKQVLELNQVKGHQNIEQEFRRNLNNKETKSHFEITDNLIHNLKEKVYKQIVLTQFIQTNLNPEILGNSKCQSDSKIYNEILSFNVRNKQIQKISDFTFGDSLQSAPYFQPFKRKNEQERNLRNEEFSINEQTKQPWNKRDALIYFNAALLEPSSIKYLNIYGPTGSGKTFTLKSIIAHKNCIKNVIWINGMNIISGKTKRFISDLKEKFDLTFWQLYKEKAALNSFSQQDFLVSWLSKENQKILILDQYDQINDFQLSDLLRYAYIKGLQNTQDSPNRDNKLFRISKVIFVSNSFESALELTPHQPIRTANNFRQRKSLYIEHLIFRPFTQKQAESILRQKIQIVNDQLVKLLHEKDQLKHMFADQIKGIFLDQQLMHIIKKVSMSEQIDIRKLLQFYVNSFKQWIETIVEIKQNPEKINQHKLKVMMRKVQNYLVDKKFLEHESFQISISDRVSFNSQDDSNPLLFYISQIQSEGRGILKAIYETLKFKKRLLDMQIHNQVLREEKPNSKIKLNIQMGTDQKLLNEKRKQNTIRIMDFYRKIKPKIELYQIYPWIYQWQQIGLIKIRKAASNQAFQEEVGIQYTSKIRIMDNYLIEVLDKKSIQEGLGLHY